MMDLEKLAAVPMRDEREIQMVEIIMLKWLRPEIEATCADLIIRNTTWPFKLVVYDNRPNTPNTARIWNKLIRQATCELVCIIDSDAFVQPSSPCWLTKMVETFQHYDDCRFVLPVTDRCAASQQRAGYAARYPTAVRAAGEWSGFCFLMRKSLIDEVGPFDEDFVGYGQDSEFAVRLARRGGGAYIRGDVWMQHLHGASFLEATRLGLHDAQADREYAQRLFRLKTEGAELKP